MVGFRNLLPGDPAPWFHQRTSSNPRFAFDTIAGRYLVLCFYASAADVQGHAAVAAVFERRQTFDDVRASFFGVSIDPRDESDKRVTDSVPGLRFFWDFDGAVSRLYGAIAVDADPQTGPIAVRRFWLVLGPTLRVMTVIPFASDGSDRTQIFSYLESLPSPDRFVGFEVQAPILVLPNVFEPEFCRTLIALYEANGGVESGFMREVDGKTAEVHDYSHKRRRDYSIEDESIYLEIQRLLKRRVLPEVLKVHQFRVTRVERYIVACYAAEDSAHFQAHRDNTTRGTAHRRFAVSINLNADFDGGDLIFPEYGQRWFKPPVGGAVVFSCSLLHAVATVTRGRRYAFLPFLYDDDAAKIREANNQFLDDGVRAYRP